jgi:hypothetical protein
MKILIENIDSSNIESEIITEGENGKKNYYIKGPFLVGESRNKNGRIYPSSILEREVQKFYEEKISKNMAGGELNHPSMAEVNPERISHMIVELKREGLSNVWIGKAKVASTPMGQIVKNLLDDGYRLGISSRGLGSVGKNSMVGEDYKLVTCDVVGSPSGPGCFLDPILEAKEYIIMEDGRIAEKAYANFESKLETLPKSSEMREEHLARAVKEFLRSIR